MSQAGRTGAVTIATNMAGRGTDILLGGNPAGLASELLHRKGLNPAEVDKDTDDAALAEAKAVTEEDHERVVKAGGLHAGIKACGLSARYSGARCSLRAKAFGNDSYCSPLRSSAMRTRNAARLRKNVYSFMPTL